MNATATERKNIIECVKLLKDFICDSQLRTMWHNSQHGEESEYFGELIEKTAAQISNMPKTYETDGQGSSAVARLHYFKGGCDWYIIEKDAGCPDESRQVQAYGAADLGYGPELGYISIAELIAHHVELDLHWTPKTIEEILK